MKFSTPTWAYSMGIERPASCSATYIRLESICSSPVATSARPVPIRATTQPPTSTPASVAHRPNTTATPATSARVKPSWR